MLPSKLKILNITDDDTVVGEENHLMNLSCSVDSGKPPETLTWRRDRSIVKQGGPSKIVYSFIPAKTDYNSTFTCEAKNADMKKPLTKSIHINIKCKKTTFIFVDFYCVKVYKMKVFNITYMSNN